MIGKGTKMAPAPGIQMVQINCTPSITITLTGHHEDGNPERFIADESCGLYFTNKQVFEVDGIWLEKDVPRDLTVIGEGQVTKLEVLRPTKNGTDPRGIPS